jgi:uncharacterized protein YcsI (UPF0317 family)
LLIKIHRLNLFLISCAIAFVNALLNDGSISVRAIVTNGNGSMPKCFIFLFIMNRIDSAVALDLNLPVDKSRG